MEHSIKELISRLEKGTCTEEEIDFLISYFNCRDLEELERELKKEWQAAKFDPASRAKMDEIWEEISKKMEPGSMKRFPFRSRRRTGSVQYFKFAAIFVGILLMSVLVFKDQVIPGTTVQEDAITIEFEDGQIETLEPGRIETFRKPGVVYETNRLSYDKVESESAGSEVTEEEYHTLHIPHGRKFQLVLSDGTEVFINSGSSLRYPVEFIKGESRTVHLEGEAFFNVSSQQERFIVSTTVVNTEVLGTQFNVSTHGNYNNTEVVLLEGSVKVYTEETSELLAPNERVTFSAESEFVSREQVNALDHIAWIHGFIWFDNESFTEIAPKLERHYDVKISNKYTDLENRKFTGRFRTESISEVLEVFRSAAAFNYEITGKNIRIRKPKSNN